ncbi:unnamed protein product [Symbiodinium natans]|uniref:AB hydrolase-1 domain-containing protein n=1 Tax=Symbiodinium natans TaxID=878477 RepID=A0A812RZB8_9DINO|nr:unnamed protein product [Symbiodinium natans]
MQFRDQVEAFLDECLAALPEAPRDVVAVGHSLGGGVLLLTQAFAKRKRFSRMLIFEPMWLFVNPSLHKLINLPVMPPSNTRLEPDVVAQAFRRRSEWPSRAEAGEKLSRKDFFASWDKRVFQAYLDGGLKGNEPCSLACSPQTEANLFLSGVPQALLDVLRRGDGLHGCELHVSIGTDTMWTRVAADELFGSLRPAPCVEVEPGGHMWPMERPKDFARRAAAVLSTRCSQMGTSFYNIHPCKRCIRRLERDARMGRTGRAVTIYIPDEYAKVKLLGRECCSKVQSKVLRRSIAAEAIQHWADKIAAFEEDINVIIQEESVDKELRLADLLAQKSDNLEKHKKNIAARPAKEWYMSNKDKAKLRQSERQSLEEAEAKALAKDEEEKEPKKRKGPLTEEEVQERRAQRNRARLKAKREAEKAEREREQLRARASAKRSRRVQRDAEEFPLTIGERIFKQKMERRKKKGSKGKAAKKSKARCRSQHVELHAAWQWGRKCEHFVILCPGLGHESGEILCQKTWEERGWCRAERTARKLALNGGPVIVIESETSQLFLTEIATCEPPVAEGRFSVDLDRKRVANIVLQLIRRRLLLLLEQNNLTEYRFLYNQQSLLLKGSGVDCVELGIPGFSPESFPDPEELLMAKFMHQNGFSSLKQRDAAGWSPMCYAAMSGNASLVSALLRRNADANDRIRKAKPQVFFSKNMHAIAIAACFRSNEVIKVLLAAHAKVDAKDGHKHTALHWSAGSNDAETVRLLVNGGADHTLKQNLGVSVLQLACFNCSGNAVRELLRLRPKQNVEQCFHYSFMLFAGSSELVQILLDAKADMNEQLDFAKTKAWPMWLLCNFSGWKYKRGLSRTRLCRMGYHHHLATPLMFTVLGGAADAAWTLLTAGARRDLKNSRGKTAFDLAFEFGTNPELVAALDPDSKLPKAFPEPSEEDEEEVPVEVRGKVPQGEAKAPPANAGSVQHMPVRQTLRGRSRPPLRFSQFTGTVQVSPGDSFEWSVLGQFLDCCGLPANAFSKNKRTSRFILLAGQRGRQKYRPSATGKVEKPGRRLWESDSDDSADDDVDKSDDRAVCAQQFGYQDDTTIKTSGMAAGDPKSKLNEFLMKYCGRPVTKQDAVYIVSRFRHNEYQCVVKLECMDGAEYAGEVCADAKAAEKSAAEQVLVGNQELVEATLQGTGGQKRKASSALSPAEKRAKADQDPADNPAITPKTQLNSLVMRIIKRYLQKGETVYDTKQVQGLYQSTVTLAALPGEWGERAWAGHLCPTKQKAEQSAADEALKDLQQDEEMQAEASKPKGAGKKGKGKGKFGPTGGGWEMGFFDHVMLGAWGWSPMSKGKGKGFGATERRIPGRDRITDAPCVGTVVEWHGQHGFLEAALPIDHPMANSRGGKIFIHQRDLPEGVESLLEGQPLSFHVFTDSSGLGAEEVVIA